MLPESLSRGTISLLPKGDKDRESLGNWRPLTLLSVEYKLISGCISGRMNKIMPNIINSDQAGFVGGRFIGEPIRLTYDVMKLAKHSNYTGLLLLVDFTKAFDSVCHHKLLQKLDWFGTCGPLHNWFKINFF